MAKQTGTFLIDPDGKLVTVSSEEVSKAIGLGYRTATNDDLSIHDYLIDNKGVKGTVKVALGQFADELAMGVPELIADHSQNDLDKAKREALKKEHNIANTIGGVAGFAGSMAYGGPLASSISKASAGAVGKLIANRLGTAAVDAGVKVGESALMKAGSSIAKAGLEGSAMMAPQAITEAYFGDYDQAAEALIAGGLVGAAVSSGIKLGGLATKSTSELVRSIGGKMGIKPSENELARITELREGSLFKNPEEITATLDRLGVKPEDWMFSDSSLVKGTVSSLSQAPTIPGLVIEKELYSLVDRAKQEVETILSPGVGKELKESGDEVQKLLSAELLENQMQITDRYKWIDENLGHLPVDDDLKQFAIDRLAASDNVQLELSTEPLSIAKSVYNIRNFNDAKLVRTATRQKATALTNNLDKSALNEAYDILTELRNNAVTKFDGTLPEIAEAQKIVRETDAMYKQVLDKYKPIDEALGGAKSKSIADVLNKITDKVESAKMVDKIFNASEISRLQLIKQNFPEVFEALKSQKMADIYSKSLDEGKLSVKKFITNMNDKVLPRDVKRMMFGDGFEQKLADLKTVMYHILPEKIGPSGTPKGLDFMNLLSISLNVRDLGRYIALKTGALHKLSSALPFVEKGLKNTADKLDDLDKVLKGQDIGKSPLVRQTISTGISRLLYGHENNHDHHDNFQKVSDRLSELNQNPESNPTTIQFATALAANGAPQIADIYQQRIQTALRYLYDMMPKDPSPPTLLRRSWHPNDAQMSKFNRIVKTVDNPFSIIEDFQKGKLTLEQVAALQATTPKIYDQIRNRVINYATTNDLTKLPYNKKIQLGILLNNRGIDNSFRNIPQYQASFQSLLAHENNPGEQKPVKTNTKFTGDKNTASDVNRITYR